MPMPKKAGSDQGWIKGKGFRGAGASGWLTSALRSATVDGLDDLPVTLSARNQTKFDPAQRKTPKVEDLAL